MQETSTSVREIPMLCSVITSVQSSRRSVYGKRVQAGLVTLMILIMDCELGYAYLQQTLDGCNQL